MSNASFMVKTKVDHLAERVTKIIFEVNKYIIAIEEMKTDARGRKSWKGACNRAIRKLVTLKGKLEYVLLEVFPVRVLPFVALWSVECFFGGRG